MKNYTNGDGVPLGFGMLLAQNEEAMKQFDTLSDAEKQSIIAGAAKIGSKQEMREYVAHIAESHFPV